MEVWLHAPQVSSIEPTEVPISQIGVGILETLSLSFISPASWVLRWCTFSAPCSHHCHLGPKHQVYLILDLNCHTFLG